MNNTEIQYNAEQINLLNSVDVFLATNSVEFSIRGIGGSGKTEMIKAIIDKYNNVGICAMTHKARTVLEERTGKVARTAQSIHGFKADADLLDINPNRLSFIKTGKPAYDGIKIMIYDEMSACQKVLYDIIIEDAIEYNVKCIFVGDEYQLPPIKEKQDKNDNYHISHALRSVDNACLTVPIRQAITNPISYLLAALRHDISVRVVGVQLLDTVFSLTQQFNLKVTYEELCDNSNGLFKYLLFKSPINYTANKEGYLKLSDFDKFQNNIIKAYDNDINTKYLAYTNDTIKKANNFIHRNIGLIDMLNINDVLLCYRTITNQDKTSLFSNSEEYRVTDVRDDTVTLIDTNKIPYYFETYNVILTKNSTAAKNPIFNKISFIKPVSYEAYMSYVCSCVLYATKNGGRQYWAKYYNFVSSYLIMDNMESVKFKTKFQSKDLRTKDFDYAYAQTTHKAQGSTYKNIIVDVKDMEICLKYASTENEVNYYKLIYTALSRASNSAIIYC